MPGSTSRGYPYPLGPEQALGSADIQGLAEAVDADIAGVAGDVAAAAAMSGFRNVVRNGDMSIAQRGNGPWTTNGAIGVDGWMLGVSGGTVSYKRLPESASDLPGAYIFVGTTGQTLPSDYVQLSQRIESVLTLANTEVTVSFNAWTTAGTAKIGVDLIQGFGIGGSANVNNYAGTVTINSNPTRYSATTTLPSIAGKTIGEDHRLGLYLWLSAGSDWISRTDIGLQNAEIRITDVQVEAGPTATGFERIPIQQQLAWCQRYYQTSGSAAGYSNNAAIFHQRTTSTAYWGSLPLYVQMRKTPAIRLYSYLGTPDMISTGATGAADLAYDTLTVYGRFLTLNVPTGATNVVHANWTATAEL